MPALASISTIGDKLIVGQVDTSFLTATGRVTPGTAVLNGPVYIGASPQIGVARAACMIGPPLPGLSVPASLEVTGIANVIGVLGVDGIGQEPGGTGFAVFMFEAVNRDVASVVEFHGNGGVPCPFGDVGAVEGQRFAHGFGVLNL